MNEKSLAYSIIIATMDRPIALKDALDSIIRQSHLPEHVIIVDASHDERTRELVLGYQNQIVITYCKAELRSAAMQRNQGIALVTTPLVGFMDDDVALASDVFEKLADVFVSKPGCGGVSARMNGESHHKPRKWLAAYYCLQAGYEHSTFGARLFGPAINCLPCYECDSIEDNLIESEWLPSTLVLFSLAAVKVAGGFPSFEGYSFMEDVWLSASIYKHRKLYFHCTALFDHFPSISSAKRDRCALARMRIRHRRKVALEVMGMARLECETKLMLLRMFDSIHLIRRRPIGWFKELIGTWTA